MDETRSLSTLSCFVLSNRFSDLSTLSCSMFVPDLMFVELGADVWSGEARKLDRTVFALMCLGRSR